MNLRQHRAVQLDVGNGLAQSVCKAEVFVSRLLILSILSLKQLDVQNLHPVPREVCDTIVERVLEPVVLGRRIAHLESRHEVYFRERQRSPSFRE